ncbi:uncharacterized protein ACN427_001115 isoform 1-T2 [Glossina fuscipes fuscipes]
MLVVGIHSSLLLGFLLWKRTADLIGISDMAFLIISSTLYVHGMFRITPNLSVNDLAELKSSLAQPMLNYSIIKRMPSNLDDVDLIKLVESYPVLYAKYQGFVRRTNIADNMGFFLEI